MCYDEDVDFSLANIKPVILEHLEKVGVPRFEPSYLDQFIASKMMLARMNKKTIAKKTVIVWADKFIADISQHGDGTIIKHY